MTQIIVPLTPEQRAAKYNFKRAIISILCLAGGTVLMTVSISLLFNVLVGLSVLGAILIVVAILIGYSKG